MDRLGEDVRRFLGEDVGARDVTSEAVVGVGVRAGGVIVARERLVLAGAVEAGRVFGECGVKVEHLAVEGAWVERGAAVLRVAGLARGVLRAERVALNFLTRMSGVASATRRLVDVARAVNPGCTVAATRKTTPGFRAYEKRAVELGGGERHREGLYDAFLVKDNHLALGVGVGDAVARCRAFAPGLVVEVEADSLAEAEAAGAAGADWVLLDNRSARAFSVEAAKLRGAFPRLRIEASGGVTPANIADFARAADRVSLGFLTMSAPAADLGLDLDAR
ncbi:MAG: carboxylating nicotinate-nucleotide diphosphorylase [Thermoplasmatota archaeon]